MVDKRRDRAWIKVQLRNTPQAFQVAEIVVRWKQQHRATEFLIQAILIFDALQQSEADPTRLALQKLNTTISTEKTRQVTPPGSTAPRPAAVIHSESVDDIDAALGAVGLAALDFS